MLDQSGPKFLPPSILPGKNNFNFPSFRRNRKYCKKKKKKSKQLFEKIDRVFVKLKNKFN